MIDTDWEGNSINTHLQQDVLEFLNILCDHLENSLKNTPYKSAILDNFGGFLSQEFISKGKEQPLKTGKGIKMPR